jgi:hypothetical protein
MTRGNQREIVIEFEKIQLIRKRARTEVRHCSGCKAASDTVSHTEAAELFETEPAKLFEFIRQNDCHHDTGHNGKTYLCVPSLIERLQQQNNIRLLAKGE